MSNCDRAQEIINNHFDSSVIPSLSQFIQIPNLSRDFDPNYNTNGLQQKAVEHLKSWVDSQGIKGLKSQILKLEGLTPLLLIQITGSIPQYNVLFYGHFDKQPHMAGWDENKAATKPVIEDNKLYGRGAADDGYAVYTAITAIKTLQQINEKYPSKNSNKQMSM